MTGLNTVLFILAAVCVMIAIYNFFKQRNNEANIYKKPLFNLKPNTYYVILGIIAFVGIAIRLWKFGSVPCGINQDGAMAAVDGKALADYRTDRFGTLIPAHLYAWGYGQMSSLLSYMIAFFTNLFGFGIITTRLPQLIASLSGGVFFYLLIKDTFGKNTALVAALFVAINPWHLVQSRWALDCNLLPHFFMGGLFFLNRGIIGKRGNIYISMIFFALCMYCYGITIYTIPVFLLAACFYYMTKKKITLKQAIICAGIYLVISWPFILTMMVNYFGWETIRLPFVTIQLFSESARSKDILLFAENPLSQLASNIVSFLNATVFQKKDLPWNDIEGFGTMYIFSIPFMAAGITELVRKKDANNKSIVVLALLAGVWAGLLTNGVNINRINIIYYAMMTLIVLGITFVMRYAKFCKISTFAAYAVCGVILVSTYFGSYAEIVKPKYYCGFSEAFYTAKAAGTDKIYITADAQIKGRPEVSEILTLFYDKTDAEYFQGKTNQSNGKNYLPYKERFSYVSMDSSVVEQSTHEDVAYVVLDTDTPLFDTNKYTITSYGKFCAVVKK